VIATSANDAFYTVTDAGGRSKKVADTTAVLSISKIF
jgi:hypothetical protein